MKTQTKKISGIITMLLLLFGLSGFGQTVITPTVTPACAGVGSVSFSVTGGVGPFTYYVEGVSPNSNYFQSQSSPTFTGLAPGYYQVYLLGSNDSATAYFTITSTVQLSHTITNTVCPANTGSITETASGGTPPYNYLWSNGGSTATINNLAGGVYMVDVTDANGCWTEQWDTIVSTTAMTVAINTTGASCGTTLTAVATGGVSPVSYGWSDGESTASITGLSTNTYFVLATDANGCTAGNSASVTVNQLYIDSQSATITYPSCATPAGSISIAMTNGTAPFSYVWANGATTSSITGLAVGNYPVTVTDANGCSASTIFYLGYQNSVQAYISSYTNPGCAQYNGSLTVTAYEANGLTGTYSYAWSDGATTAEIAGLGAGTYSVTITDANTCTTSVSYTLTGIAQFQVSITTTPTACDTTLYTGTATAIITGNGTAPYNFLWTEWSYSQGQYIVIGTSQTVGGLGVNASVQLTVTDANGCSTNASGYDSTFIQLDPSCYDHIVGYVFNDTNGNCLHDIGETGFSNVYVIATAANGNTYYGNPDSSGAFDIEVFPGSYTVTIEPWDNGSCTVNSCITQYFDTFATTGLVSSGNNFAMNSGTATFDLGVHMGYEGSAPGQTREYWVYYYNWGQTAVANGTLTFTHDPHITLVNTIPAYTSYDPITHIITWDIVNNLAPMNWLDQQHQVVMYFGIPDTLSLGTELTASASITPVAGDCNPNNNYQTLTDLVTASHDPNSKEVSPSGNLSATDTLLTYTIRFQNTGNGPASLVVISDTLSPNVDPATVIPGASSSPYTWKMSGNGIITFTFEPINLVDSAQNANGSEGFVMYTVQVKKNLPLGSVINNTAYVYFDANAPVVTNTTTSVRSNYATGIHNLTANPMTAQVIPNPASDQARIEFNGSTGSIFVRIIDDLGNVIATENSVNTYYTINATRLAAGIYYYTAKDEAGNTVSGKISVVH